MIKSLVPFAIRSRPKCSRNVEPLEARHLLAAVPFGEKQVIDDLDADNGDFLFPNRRDNSSFPRRRDALAVKLKVRETGDAFTAIVLHLKAKIKT